MKKKRILLVAVPLLVFGGIVAVTLCFMTGMETSSEEAITISNLRLERSLWLEDGCPQPPQATNYIQVMAPTTNYTYIATHVINGHTYHGLFATANQSLPGTFVITTDGKIIVREKSGQVSLWKHQ